VARTQDVSIHDIDGEMLNTATSVATSGRFADPFAAGQTGETAHVSPLPTYLLAAVLRIAPDSGSATTLSRLIATFSVCLQLLLMLAVARSLGLNAREIGVTGYVFALYPVNPYAELNGAWGQPYAAIAVAITALVLSGRWTASGRKAALAGFVVGIALLVTPVALLFASGFVARRAWLSRGRIQRWPFASRLGIALVGLLVALAPWTARNRVVMGHWFLVRDNLGLELGVSNYPGASPTRRGNAASFSEYHPNVSEEAAARVQEVGEVAYGAEMQRRALGWMSEEPWEFLRLSAARASLFWLPRSGGLRSVVEVATLGLMILGLITALRGRRLLLTDLGLGIAAFSTIYAVVQVSPRYSYPVQWAVMILVGVGAVTLLNFTLGWHSRPTRG
jgi:hypothetical protein